MGGRELARLRCYRVQVDRGRLGKNSPERKLREGEGWRWAVPFSHGGSVHRDLKVTGKWNARGRNPARIYL